MRKSTPLKPSPSLHAAFSRTRLVQYFFFAVLLFLIWQCMRILAPFYVALMGSAILALLTYPMHDWLLKRLRRYPSIAAAVSTVGVVIIVVLPILLFGWMCIRETGKVYPVVNEWIQDTEFFQSGPILDRLPARLVRIGSRVSELTEKWHVDPQEVLLKNLDQLSDQMTRLAGGLIKNTLVLVFNILVLTFTLFFFLRDGPFLIRRTVELVPMAPVNKKAILSRLQITLYAVIRGVFVVAIIQGILAGIGYYIFNVPFPVLLGALTSFLATIPVIGPAAIWVPVSLGLFISEAYKSAFGILIWGLLVSAVDNFLRPVLISADAKVPILLLFFGMLGGLRVYGFSGILLGPITIALLLAFITIYRREYNWLLNPSNAVNPPK